jgi:hypothetical protein
MIGRKSERHLSAADHLQIQTEPAPSHMLWHNGVSEKNSREIRMVRIIGLTVLVPALLLSLVVQAHPQTADTPYPHMAPLDQYLIADWNAEIALW